ncbi:MAG: lipoyl(octanoyl) transferase LipB [Planctomycetia bacterium]|nr:lipoyl(octanoyl) transferase LipB [Planctomycetia bacterium]
MIAESPNPALSAAELTLQAYLLGTVEFEAAQSWQRRLVYQVGGDRRSACLLLCEHPPLITIGRQGSWGQLRFELDELEARRWPVRWVNRGGGCQLHVPGQLTAYAVVPLDRLGLGLQAYLDRLQQVVADVLADFSVVAERAADRPGIWVGGRPIATFGVSVRDWVAYYGCVLNVAPDLLPFRRISCGGPSEPPMTSLACVRHGAVRPAMVRERFVEHFVARFGFARTAVFFDHPALNKRAPSDAVAARPS